MSRHFQPSPLPQNGRISGMRVKQQSTFPSAEASIVWRGSICGLDLPVGTLSTSIVMLGTFPFEKNHDKSHENIVGKCACKIGVCLQGRAFRALIFEACRSDVNCDLRTGSEREETTIY